MRSKNPRDRLSNEQSEQIEVDGAVTQTEGISLPETMRIDLHCHTEASPDSITPIEDIPDRCLVRGVQIQAITDHHTLTGAQRLQEIVSKNNHPDLTIIVGEEITTRQGELIGLFLKKKIERGLTPRETVKAIKNQGGLVLLPHGFDPLRLPRLKAHARQEIVESIDIIETFNARISRPHWNRAAAEWAKTHGILQSAGSDAHTLEDIGSAWVEVEERPIKTPQDLMEALKGGVPVGKWTHPLIAYLYKTWDKIRRRSVNWFSELT